MEHLLHRSKCSIFHNILENLTFQRRQNGTETCAGNPGKENDSKEETVREPLSNLTNL